MPGYYCGMGQSVVSPLEVGTTAAAVSDAVGCSDILVLCGAMRNWPFDLTEAADWLENDPQN